MSNLVLVALRGGLPGALAMLVQIILLMWLRTVSNFQHKHGVSLVAAIRILYSEGGVARFYQGLLPSLIQGPLCRFGDTASNAVAQSLLSKTAHSLSVKMLFASLLAACWRIVIMPVDTIKTALQVSGSGGVEVLMARVGKEGVIVLYDGAVGAAVATAVGHYPWFWTFNALSGVVPVCKGRGDLVRSAVLGVAASFVSDLASNVFRVVKTVKQVTSLLLVRVVVCVVCIMCVCVVFGWVLRCVVQLPNYFLKPLPPNVCFL
eukprot:c7636_g1_i1.p1 GENE.c7636_g1_i1~~c7636_g1_i1.p1  ORF type:complete len:275 (-),score=69.27 c7636_g1_i1:488-1273(-)